MGKRKRRLMQDESGIASILITLILIIVISLIVLGFAQVARQETNESLDRELSTQAYYAAETGINDALNAIENGNYTPNKTTCTGDVTDTGVDVSNTLNSSTNTGYSCLLINSAPQQLQYDVANNSSSVAPLLFVSDSSGAPDAPASMQIAFQSSSASSPANFTACNAANSKSLPPAPTWDTALNPCNAGVLQIDIIPANSLTASNPVAAIESQTLSLFLVPSVNGATSSFTYDPATFSSTTSGSANASIVNVACSNRQTPGCVFTLNFNGNAGTQYYMRISSFYEANTVVLQSATDIGNTPLDFSGAEALIDSTGKAQTVLRRIEIYKTLANIGANAPSFAIQSVDSICKLFYVTQSGGGALGLADQSSTYSGEVDTTACQSY